MLNILNTNTVVLYNSLYSYILLRISIIVIFDLKYNPFLWSVFNSKQKLILRDEE